MLAKDILEEFNLECELRRLTPRTSKGHYNSTLLFLTWLERHQEIHEPGSPCLSLANKGS